MADGCIDGCRSFYHEDEVLVQVGAMGRLSVCLVWFLH